MTVSRKRLPAEERKKQILKCAVKVFAGSNYRKAKISDIAKEAGISEAMIYKYFPTKKAVFLQVLGHMSERILTFWQEEFDKEPDALSALYNMVLAYYSRMIKHPDDLKVHFQAVSEIDDKDIFNRLHKDHQAYMDFIRKVIKKGIKQGSIRKDIDVEAITFLYNGGGIIMNMMKLLAFDDRFNRKLVVKLAEHLMDSIRA